MTSRAQGLRNFSITPAVRPGDLPSLIKSGAGGNPLGTGQVVTQISLALGLFEFGDDLFEVLLIAGFVVFAVPMTMIETDDVPVATGLTVRPQPLQDAGPSLCRRSAIGGRVMQVELTREEGPQAPVVVPRNGVADKEVARELGVIEPRLDHLLVEDESPWHESGPLFSGPRRGPG